jgi:hypothetical protein
MFFLHAGVAVAGGAGFGDDGAGAAAGSAGTRDGEKSLLETDLAATAALLAGDRAAAHRSAGAATGGAMLHAADFDFCFLAEDGLFKFEGEVVAKIATALLTRAAAATDVEHLAEKIAEDVIDVAAGEGTAVAPAGAAETGMAVLVIHGAFVWIAEDLICLADGFELFLRRVVAGVAVGMELHGEFAIRALKLLVGGFARDAE